MCVHTHNIFREYFMLMMPSGVHELWCIGERERECMCVCVCVCVISTRETTRNYHKIKNRGSPSGSHDERLHSRRDRWYIVYSIYYYNLVTVIQESKIIILSRVHYTILCYLSKSTF